MTILISTFPPLRDGIARYAAQQVRWLREQGETVFTIGLLGSEADAVVDLRGGWRPLSLIRQLQIANCKLRIGNRQSAIENGVAAEAPLLELLTPTSWGG